MRTFPLDFHMIEQQQEATKRDMVYDYLTTCYDNDNMLPGVADVMEQYEDIDLSDTLIKEVMTSFKGVHK